jgi:PAS domain S-box-containing protein
VADGSELRPDLQPAGSAAPAPRARANSNNDGARAAREERVLVHVPRGADEPARSCLDRAGLRAEDCPGVEELVRRLREGAGAAVLAEEALTTEALAMLAAARVEQPAWSDFPLIILTGAGAGDDLRRLERLEPLGNVVLVERSARPASLVSAVRAALRARRRQYQERDRREEQARVEQSLRESEARFLQIADNLPDGFIYQIVEDPPGQVRFRYVSAGVEPLLGVTPAEVIADPQVLYGRIDPEDLPRMRAAEEAAGRNRTPFDVRFRSRGRDGTVRWLHCRSAPRPLPGGAAVWDGITVDVTERLAMEETLREADRRKDEFLAMLAHELRNPLAPIRNAVHVMRLLGTPNAEMAWARDVVDRQAQYLTRLVDDLLDVARIARGKVWLYRERVDLAAAIARAVETARPTIEARRHALAVTLPPEPVYLDADPTRLAQVVGNLLTNAAKYTDEGGRITLSAEVDAGWAAVRVRDTGVGIAPEMLGKVFDLFTQVDHSRPRSDGGLGIGLTLVKRLTELHGGTVAAYSDGPGKGSEFVVRLPLG